MATQLGVAYLSIAASTGGLGRDIERQFGGIGPSTGRKMGSGILSGLKGAISPLAGVVAAAGLAKLGASAIQVGIETASGMEQAKISFTTMLGSAKKADAFVRKMTKFAAETPFEMAGLQESSSQLIAAGVDASKIIPIMRTLGDVTSGMGTGAEGIDRAIVALQQMNAAQKISAEDLNQLRDAGVPVYDLLAAAMGKSKQEVVALAQKGKLGKDALDQMMKALETGKGLEKFNGLMQKQSQSLVGMWSNLHDAFAQGMAGVVEPVLPLVKASIGKLTSWLPGALNSVSSTVAKLVSGATGWYKSLAGGGAPSALASLVTLLSPVKMLFEAVRPILPQVGAAFAQIGATMAANLAPALSQAAPLLQQVVSVVAGSMQQVILALLPAITQLAGILLPLLTQTIATLAPGVTSLVQALLPVASVVGGLISAALPPLMQILQALAPVFSAVVSAVSELAQALSPVISIVIELEGYLGQALVAALNLIAPAIGAVSPYLAAFIRWLGSALSSAIKFATTGTAGIIYYAKAAGTNIAKAISAFMSLKDGILGALSGAGKWLVDTGANLLRGLWQGVADKVGWLRDQIGGAMQGVIDWVKDKFQVHSPSRVFRRIGTQLTAGLAIGVTSSTSTVSAAMEKVTSLIEGAARKAGKAAKRIAAAAASMVKAQSSTHALWWSDDARSAQSLSRMIAGKASGATLADYAQARSLLASQISDARSTLDSLQQSRQQMQSQVASSVTGELDLSAAVKRGGAKGIAAAVAGLAGKAQQFAQRMKALIAAGYPAGIVQEVAGLGLSTAIRVADALLSASASQRSSIISDYSSLVSWSSAAGDYVAGQMYDVGIAAQQGVIDGLLANDKKLEDAAEKLADKLTKAVKKKLGIKSPSRVFRDEVGLQVARGAAEGIEQGKSVVAAAGRGLVSPGTVSVGVTGGMASQPIVMDGAIVAWVKRTADGVARLVLADESLNAQLAIG